MFNGVLLVFLASFWMILGLFKKNQKNASSYYFDCLFGFFLRDFWVGFFPAIPDPTIVGTALDLILVCLTSINLFYSLVALELRNGLTH